MSERAELWCGDCLELMQKIPAGSVSAIVTDPPYGMSYKSNRQGVDRKVSNRREGDVVVRESYFSHIENDDTVPIEWLGEAYKVLCDGGALYAFCHWDKWDALKAAVVDAGFSVKNMLVMNKSNHGMGDLRGSYAPKHELLLFAVKGRHLLRFPNGRGKDVWDLPVKFSGAVRLHPNEKPIAWLTPAIENSSDQMGAILDPFMGSGTTGVACARLNRRFIGIEKDPTYFEIAKRRIDEALGVAA